MTLQLNELSAVYAGNSQANASSYHFQSIHSSHSHVGTLWQIIVDATTPNFTKASRTGLHDALCEYFLMKIASEPALLPTLLLSIFVVFQDGFTVRPTCLVMRLDILPGGSVPSLRRSGFVPSSHPAFSSFTRTTSGF